MTGLTPERRAELRELLESATDGPWYWRNTQGVYLFGARSRVVMAFERMGMQGAQPVFRDASNVLFPAGKANLLEIADARLIAEAVNALPALLDAADERDRLAAQVERVRALTYESDGGPRYGHDGHSPIDGYPECPGCWSDDILSALDDTD